MPFGTQVIGDANSRPTLVAAPSFVGLGVLSTDEYTGAGGKGIDGGDPEYVFLFLKKPWFILARLLFFISFLSAHPRINTYAWPP